MCVLCLFFTVMLLIGMLISSWQQQQELTKHPVPLRMSVCVSAGIIVNVCMMKFRKEDVAMHYTIFVSPSSSLYVLFLHLHKAKLEKHATSFFLLLISPSFLTIATIKNCKNETRSLLREIFLNLTETNVLIMNCKSKLKRELLSLYALHKHFGNAFSGYHNCCKTIGYGVLWPTSCATIFISNDDFTTNNMLHICFAVKNL